MRRGFVTVRVGRFRRSAARGMARAGFPAWLIHRLLGIAMAKAQAIVEAKHAPNDLWSAAEIALFREGRR